MTGLQRVVDVWSKKELGSFDEFVSFCLRMKCFDDEVSCEVSR